MYGCNDVCGVLIYRVGHNRMYTPYMTVHLVISLPKLLYIHRIYMVLANPNYLFGEHGNFWQGTPRYMATHVHSP
jgi:hypothetical protein